MAAANNVVGVDLGLSDEEKKELHRIARTVIETKARRSHVPGFAPSTPLLGEKRGAFVSIYKKGLLRGCVGSVEPVAPLHKTISEMASAAAFNDSRFRPISEDELPHLVIEISVLTPIEEIKDPEAVKVGLHGIIIRKGGRSGLLLPQVASERNWDRRTFLEETCRKAGLPRDAWKDDDTRIYIFSADVF
jgi:AmmeMemoRadiSam system protein A